MLLAPWRHHGDHAQAHREAAGGEEEGCEDGGEGDQVGSEEDFGAQEDVCEEHLSDEENCEQSLDEEGAGAEDVVEPHDEAARRIQPEA